MQRGVYFDGWYPRQHNYHPSLPAGTRIYALVASASRRKPD
jgi:hypothetical protein